MSVKMPQDLQKYSYFRKVTINEQNGQLLLEGRVDKYSQLQILHNYFMKNNIPFRSYVEVPHAKVSS